jgi:hypothetical protein
VPETVGFQSVPTRFNPSRYFLNYPRVNGQFDADYRDFVLTGQQTQALERTVKFAHSLRIPVVFVNLPLTPTYLDRTRSFYETLFRQRMQQLAQTNQFVFKDLGDRPALQHNHYFADPSHLNRYGAIAVATALGQDLVGTWPALLQRSMNRSSHPRSPREWPISGISLYFPPIFAG